MTHYYKYPRTPYLPWSPTSTPGQIVPADRFRGKRIYVSEKLDGENVTLYRDGMHARSVDSTHHASRSWLKGFHAGMAYRIPTGWRFVGEYLYARHSIPYTDLESYFYLLSIWDQRNICLNMARTKQLADMFGFPMPRQIYWGEYDEDRLLAIRVDTEISEGYVVRNSHQFHYEDFGTNVAKWVRPGHIQTDEHWTHTWEPNESLRSV